MVMEAVKSLTADEITELCLRHTLYDWSAQAGLKPLPVTSARGVVHVLDPYHGIQRGWDTVEDALANLEETIQLEGPATIAAFILEPITGTNGILVPPDGYLQGVRAICDRYGILMICDEVMTGFGRTGRWFAVDHWGVVPDLITIAKGLTSSYVPLGAVGMRPHVALRALVQGHAPPAAVHHRGRARRRLRDTRFRA